ncbi:hypothetical protein F6V30_16680 [Oryzomonas sagensis]|uniref:Cohesin domain-containing protein n=1 Tax=Oryzomonas sagensis TaxID=2603857 RepID=A0ABQ6TJU9_9BACT|nr:hypothetical protein [Oryzomonas sagensis]KAB0668175.1 hypothetical protein F6V30_16680 [Oryzomonas sagensis]
MRVFKIMSVLMTIPIMVISGCGGGGSGGGNGGTSDTTAPAVTAFSMPSSAASLTVSVLSFTATDNVGVVGYMITESATPPVASASGWSSTAPPSFTFTTAGSKTAYAWAKDASGNISNSLIASVTITQQSTLTTSISGIPANAYSIKVVLDFTKASGYDFAGYIDSNGPVKSSYITALTSSGIADAHYDSANKTLTLGVVSSNAINDGNIMSVQFQAVPGFDATQITSTVTEIKNGSGVSLPITGATTVSETVQ